MIRRAVAGGSLEATSSGGVHLAVDIGLTGMADDGKYRCDVTYVGHGVKGGLKQGVLSADADLRVWPTMTSVLTEMTSLREQLANRTGVCNGNCTCP